MSITKTLTKNEVIALLGRSKRTIDTYMADGRLKYHYVNGPNGKQSAFDLADVERLKRDLEAPIEPERIERGTVESHVRMSSTSLQTANGRGADPFEGLAAHLAKLSTMYGSPAAVYVSMKDAVRITGLSASTLKALAGTEVKTRSYGGGVRYRRADLEAL